MPEARLLDRPVDRLPGQVANSGSRRLRAFQDHRSPQPFDQGSVADELDGVAQPLLGMEQDGSSFQRLPVPECLRKVARLQLFGLSNAIRIRPSRLGNLRSAATITIDPRVPRQSPASVPVPGGSRRPLRPASLGPRKALPRLQCTPRQSPASAPMPGGSRRLLRPAFPGPSTRTPKLLCASAKSGFNSSARR